MDPQAKKEWLRKFMWQQISSTLVFIIGLIACYQGALRRILWLGPLVILIIAITRFVGNKEWLAELKLVVSVGVIGLILESLLITVGIYTANTDTRWVLPAPICPEWSWALWINFGLKMKDYMWVMKGKPVRGFLVGLFFGIMIFSSVQRMGLGTLNYGKISILIGAVSWGIIVPLLFHIASKILVLPSFSGAESKK